VNFDILIIQCLPKSWQFSGWQRPNLGNSMFGKGQILKIQCLASPNLENLMFGQRPNLENSMFDKPNS